MNLKSCLAGALPLGLLSAVSFYAVPVEAQAQASDQGATRTPARLEEIVVTARRREERAQDVPVAITALGAELQRPTVRDLSDLNGFAPNVRIDRDQGRSNAASVSIRGISPTRTDDNSFDPPIGIMIDGIYLGSIAGQLLENFDVERVEILRGPQGTLFGRNTVGGVVNVVRSRPTGEYGARLRLGVGRHDAREARVVLNAPVIEDQLAIKAFGTVLQDDGYMFNVTTGNRQPERDYRNYGVTLLATPTPRFEALFTAERFDDRSDIGAFNTNFNLAPGVADPPEDPERETDLSGGLLACTVFGACRTSLDIPSTSEGNFANPGRTKTDAFTLNMQYQLNDNLSLVAVTGYRDMVEERLTDFDASAVDFITIDRDNDYEQFSAELRLEGSYERFNFVSGIYYWESEHTQDWITGGSFWSFLNPGLVGDGVTPNETVMACLAGQLGALRCDPDAPLTGYGPDIVQVLFSTQKTTAWAGFAQVDWEFTDNWILNAGLRWTNEKKDFLAGQAYLTSEERGRLRNFQEFSDLDNRWKEWSPRIGLSYVHSDDLLFYASYAEGFHSGGFFGVNQNIADFERDQYDPEFAKTFELGMKSQWLDDSLLVNAALFYNIFEDKQEESIQVDPSTNTVATIFDNVAEAIYWGAELELQWAANEYLHLFTSVGYLNAKFDEFETFFPNDPSEELRDASFLTPRNAPEWTLGLGGTFTYPVARGFVELHAKYDWVDEVESSLFNTRIGRLSSRENLNASIRYYTADDRFSLTLFGRNITNEKFEVVTLVQPLFAAGTRNRGYTWGLEFEANF